MFNPGIHLVIVLVGLAVNEIPAKFLGAWSGTGTFLGRPSTFFLCANQAVHSRYMQLDYEVRQDARRVFRGTAYYKAGADASTYTGKWFDSNGSELELNAVVDESRRVMRTSWTGSNVSGLTVYEVNGDSLSTRESIASAGSERVFATATYKRSEVYEVDS